MNTSLKENLNISSQDIMTARLLNLYTADQSNPVCKIMLNSN